MAGLLKRKFDQLEEDDFSSSYSGSLSLSSSPGSSVYPAWNSDEEGPCAPTTQPDQDSHGTPSFTSRESSALGTPNLHTHPLLPKGEIGLFSPGRPLELSTSSGHPTIQRHLEYQAVRDVALVLHVCFPSTHTLSLPGIQLESTHCSDTQHMAC